jgi:hypothetical protein
MDVPLSQLTLTCTYTFGLEIAEISSRIGVGYISERSDIGRYPFLHIITFVSQLPRPTLGSLQVLIQLSLHVAIDDTFSRWKGLNIAFFLMVVLARNCVRAYEKFMAFLAPDNCVILFQMALQRISHVLKGGKDKRVTLTVACSDSQRILNRLMGVRP